MNSQTLKEFAVVVVAVIVALSIFSFVSNKTSGVGGGVTNFGGGISLDSLAVTGDTAFTGALAITGATTLTGATTAGTLTQGGGIRATTTTATSATLLASDFDTENVIDVTPGGASLTLTLPATSTLTSFIPTAGQTRTIYIRNATTTAGIALTIAAGTGVPLKIATSTSSGVVILGDTDGSNYGRIDFLRKANTDIEALLSIFAD